MIGLLRREAFDAAMTGRRFRGDDVAQRVDDPMTFESPMKGGRFRGIVSGPSDPETC